MNPQSPRPPRAPRGARVALSATLTLTLSFGAVASRAPAHLATSAEAKPKESKGAKGAKGAKDSKGAKGAQDASDSPAIAPESASAARGVYTDLKQNPDAAVRAAITRGLIELGGADREGALDDAQKAADVAVRVAGVEEALRDPKRHKARLKWAEDALFELLTAPDEPTQRLAQGLLSSSYDLKAQRAWWGRMLKSSAAPAQRFARARLIGEGGKEAWAVVEAALKEPLESEAHKDALAAIREKNYLEAKGWAVSHAGDPGADGVVAREWIGKLAPALTDKMNKDLLKEYEKAAGDYHREGDFLKRVHLAHMLSARGELKAVQDTLVVAVKDKQGRIDKDLDDARVRVMGWEGLKACRDHEVLAAIKQKMIDLQNREEAAPAVDWLADWVRDTNDPIAKQTLEEIAQQTQYISRLEAIRALGSLKLRDSLPIIESALLNGDDPLREVSATALATIANKGDEEKLHKSLLAERKSDVVRVELLKGVARVATPETLKTVKYWLINPSRDVRAAALAALDASRVGRAELDKILGGKLQNDPDLSIRLNVWRMLLEAKSDKLDRQFKNAARWMEPEHARALGANPQIPGALFVRLAVDGGAALSAAVLDLLEARGAAAVGEVEAVLKESFSPATTERVARLYLALKREGGVGVYEELVRHRDAVVRAVGLEGLRLYGAEPSRQVTRDLIENEREPLPRVQAARAFVALSLRFPAPAPAPAPAPEPAPVPTPTP